MKKIEISPKAKRVLLIVLCVVLALVLVALILGTAYMEKMLNLINRNPVDGTMSSEEYEDFINSDTEGQDENVTAETVDPGDVDWGTSSGTLEKDENIINIMLIGQDRRPGEGRTRSDVMILCTINKNTNQVILTSFLRDMYVQIPGYDANRMNACYAFGGMPLLESCLQQNFGVQVDGNIEVDFDAFTEVIDLVGGVDIYLSNSEADYVNRYGGSGAVPGWNRLNGKNALAHARNRSVGSGDFSRTERQREVLNALFEKCKKMSVSKLNAMAESILPEIRTDMTKKEILNYLMDLLPMLGDMTITNQRIPADDTFKYATINGRSVLLADMEANRAILLESKVASRLCLGR